MKLICGASLVFLGVVDGCVTPTNCLLTPATAITIRVRDSRTGRLSVDGVIVAARQTVSPAYDASVLYAGRTDSEEARIVIEGGPGRYDLMLRKTGYAAATLRDIVVSSEAGACLRSRTTELTVSLDSLR